VAAAPVSVSPNGDGTETLRWDLPWSDTGFVRVKVTLNSPSAAEYTEVSGWSLHGLAQQAETFCMPYLPAAKFAGKISGATGTGGSILTIAAESLGNTDFKSLLTPAKSYYLEVVGGPNAGHRFDIDYATSTPTQIGIKTATPNNNSLAAVPGLSGSPFVVREHFTLAQLFPVAEYHPGTALANSDNLMIFNRSTGSWTTYRLLATTQPRWVEVGGPISLPDRGSVVVNPAFGVFVVRRAGGLPAVLSGEVRSTDFAAPLALGGNFLANPYPFDASPVQRRITLTDGFTGGTNLATSDQILLWAADANDGIANPVPPAPAGNYETHFLLNAANPAYRYWTKSGGVGLPNENTVKLFKRNRATWLTVRVPHPNYVMPCPWQP
jgi:hypothetical protein